MEPEIGPFQFYIDAYRELATCKIGMGDGPIPFTAIVEYSNIVEIEDFDEFLYIIRRLDSVILKRRSQNAQKSNTKNNNKVRGRRS